MGGSISLEDVDDTVVKLIAHADKVQAFIISELLDKTDQQLLDLFQCRNISTPFEARRFIVHHLNLAIALSALSTRWRVLLNQPDDLQVKYLVNYAIAHVLFKEILLFEGALLWTLLHNTRTWWDHGSASIGGKLGAVAGGIVGAGVGVVMFDVALALTAPISLPALPLVIVGGASLIATAAGLLATIGSFLGYVVVGTVASACRSIYDWGRKLWYDYVVSTNKFHPIHDWKRIFEKSHLLNGRVPERALLDYLGIPLMDIDDPHHNPDEEKTWENLFHVVNQEAYRNHLRTTCEDDRQVTEAHLVVWFRNMACLSSSCRSWRDAVEDDDVIKEELTVERDPEVIARHGLPTPHLFRPRRPPLVRLALVHVADPGDAEDDNMCRICNLRPADRQLPCGHHLCSICVAHPALHNQCPFDRRQFNARQVVVRV